MLGDSEGKNDVLDEEGRISLYACTARLVGRCYRNAPRLSMAFLASYLLHGKVCDEYVKLAQSAIRKLEGGTTLLLKAQMQALQLVRRI